jgi:hypothetical protein
MAVLILILTKAIMIIYYIENCNIPIETFKNLQKE